jgi:hypothetical protein
MERARTEILMPGKSKYIQRWGFNTGILLKERKMRKTEICVGKMVKLKFIL